MSQIQDTGWTDLVLKRGGRPVVAGPKKAARGGRERYRCRQKGRVPSKYPNWLPEAIWPIYERAYREIIEPHKDQEVSRRLLRFFDDPRLANVWAGLKRVSLPRVSRTLPSLECKRTSLFRPQFRSKKAFLSGYASRVVDTLLVLHEIDQEMDEEGRKAKRHQYFTLPASNEARFLSANAPLPRKIVWDEISSPINCFIRALVDYTYDLQENVRLAQNQIASTTNFVFGVKYVDAALVRSLTRHARLKKTKKKKIK